jgi:spore germination protein PE
MLKRTSIVNHTKVINVSLSSVFQIGDSAQITPRSRALAVQRQLQLFYGNEGNFEQFPIFTIELPKPNWQENITIGRYNPSPFIKVNRINITSVAAASIYHIGSTNYVDSESRVKHIRQLLHDNETN